MKNNPSKLKLNQEVKRFAEEIETYIRYLVKDSHEPKTKYILFAHYRSGTTLLTNLLNSHPDISGDGEIFLKFIYEKNHKVLFPYWYIKDKLTRIITQVYGFELKLSQLIMILPKFYGDPKHLLSNLYQDGWHIIYLKRQNILRQAVSNITAIARQQWHDLPNKPLKRSPVYINCKQLINSLQWCENIQFQEKKILENIPHLPLIYEEHLLNSEKHQETLNKIFDYLGIESAPIQTKLKRVSSENLSDSIQNYEEVVNFISQTKYANFLD